ncbi:hypothetical protein FRB97_005213 [Tulasnella sp. 331]|nr:hypothetical protein FRB98_000352 [Tulasnella sp. 332]KAG8875315.1 hypothetical protein FRB97_005213 [Tulasnella sp. 331]
MSLRIITPSLRIRPASCASSSQFIQTRSRSTSPYGRSHLRKQPDIPNPVVPHFRQRVILSDGSTFTHMTTSPRSIIRLTRDLTNNPFWSPSSTDISFGDEEAGRMGRFKRKFGSEDEDKISFEQMDGPLGEQTGSEAVQKAQKLGLGGKWRWVGGDEKKKK